MCRTASTWRRVIPDHVEVDPFPFAQRNYCFGNQYDCFDHPNTIGWLRTSDPIIRE